METSSDQVFKGRYNTYPNSYIKQTCNIIRFLRIILSKSLVQYYTALKDSNNGKKVSEINVEDKILDAGTSINTLARKVCYSAAEYIDCFGPAATESGGQAQG
jgi:hypothetical protein